jgi:hypothetical protein
VARRGEGNGDAPFSGARPKAGLAVAACASLAVAAVVSLAIGAACPSIAIGAASLARGAAAWVAIGAAESGCGTLGSAIVDGTLPFGIKCEATQRRQSAVRHSVSKKESGPRRPTDMARTSAENARLSEHRNRKNTCAYATFHTRFSQHG